MFHRKNGRAYHGTIEDITARQRTRIIRCADGEPVTLDDLTRRRERGATSAWVIVGCMFGGAAMFALGWLLMRLAHH